jgi:hypothetical protein
MAGRCPWCALRKTPESGGFSHTKRGTVPLAPPPLALAAALKAAAAHEHLQLGANGEHERGDGCAPGGAGGARAFAM